ncbi:hypothetical protein AOLI_G00330330 [Acnodon oligacanthus]
MTLLITANKVLFIYNTVQLRTTKQNVLKKNVLALLQSLFFQRGDLRAYFLLFQYNKDFNTQLMMVKRCKEGHADIGCHRMLY